MKKIKIILDSFSGLTKKDTDKLGYGFLPQVAIFDGQPYKDGIDLVMEDAIEIIKNAKDVKTSMPAIGEIMDMLDETSKESDMVIYLPMNRGMSATSGAAMNAAKEHKNVHVIETKLIADGLVEVAAKAKKMGEDGKTIEEIEKFIMDMNEKSITRIIPKDVSGIIRSGRLTGAKKVLLEKAKLIPVLKVEMDGFETGGIKRNFTKTIKSTVEKIADRVKKIKEYTWCLIHTGDKESLKTLEVAVKATGADDIRTVWAPTTVTAHLNIGGVGISVFPKIK